MADDVLRLEQVTKDYGTEIIVRAVDHVDLRIARGEFTALIGPSGSGKSTLLNLVGLLDRPTSGKVILDGQDTTQLDDIELTGFRGRSLGFVFQFHHLLTAFSARENVLMPLYAARGHVDDEMRARAAMLLGDVGLADKVDTRSTQLSGGQQQRVAIARALMADPPILLADEPTGNLDTHSADSIFDLFRRFNQERRTTILIVTHDPRLADRCDRQIKIVDGQICSDVTAR